MKASFSLGKIGGVPVGVNWSVLVIFGLIVWGIADEYLPAAYPNQPTWAYVASGVGTALVFFAGLLAHEVSHAVLAKRNGIKVKGITLWLLGGVARLEGEAKDPGADLRIAGVGPLVSLLIGLVFGGVAAAIGLLAGTGLTFAVFLWLGGINVALAVFNIIPAAPLDGGRLLRAALWKWRGDRTWAAVISARSGRALGIILIAAGFWELFANRGGYGGIWLAVLGWFLIGAATAEERQARVGGALAGLRVRDVMSPDPYTAPADTTVADFLDTFMFRHRFASFPIMEPVAAGVSGAGGGPYAVDIRELRPVGLVTVKRVKQVGVEARDTTKLRDIGSSLSVTPVAGPEDPLGELLTRLRPPSDGRALVVDAAGRLVGIVSRSDVVRALKRAQPGRRRARAV